MSARMTVRSCENVRAEQLRKATLPGMLRCLIPSALILAHAGRLSPWVACTSNHTSTSRSNTLNKKASG